MTAAAREAPERHLRRLWSNCRASLGHELTAPLVVLALGVFSRVYVAATTFMMHGDEAMNLETGSYPGVAGVLEQMRIAHAHPPLYFLLLHFSMWLTEGLLFHRLLNVFLITASAWFFYRWLRETFDSSVALVGLALYFLSPGLFFVSLQVRPYSLLLFGITGGLHYFHRALRSRTNRDIALSVCLLGIASASHYSAVFFLAAFSAYTLVLTCYARDRRALFLWLGSNVAVTALYGAYYVWHMSHIRPAIDDCAASYLARGLFNPKASPITAYLSRSNISLFRFLFGRDRPVLWLLLFVLLALPLAMLRRADRTAIGRTPLVLVLLPLPYLASMLAGVLGKYPHYGLRHSLFLLPFICTAIALACVSVGRWVPRLRPLGVGLLLAYAVWASPFVGSTRILDDEFIPRQLDSYARRELTRAEQTLRSGWMPGDLVILSTADSFYFRYYFGAAHERWPGYPLSHTGFHTVGQFSTFVDRRWHDDPVSIRTQITEFLEHPSNAHRSVWCVSFMGGEFMEREFLPNLTHSTQHYGIIGIFRVRRKDG